MATIAVNHAGAMRPANDSVLVPEGVVIVHLHPSESRWLPSEPHGELHAAACLCQRGGQRHGPARTTLRSLLVYRDLPRDRLIDERPHQRPDANEGVLLRTHSRALVRIVYQVVDPRNGANARPNHRTGKPRVLLLPSNAFDVTGDDSSRLALEDDLNKVAGDAAEHAGESPAPGVGHVYDLARGNCHLHGGKQGP